MQDHHVSISFFFMTICIYIREHFSPGGSVAWEYRSRPCSSTRRNSTRLVNFGPQSRSTGRPDTQYSCPHSGSSPRGRTCRRGRGTTWPGRYLRGSSDPRGTATALTQDRLQPVRNEMIGVIVLDHDSALVRLYWAGRGQPGLMR